MKGYKLVAILSVMLMMCVSLSACNDENKDEIKQLIQGLETVDSAHIANVCSDVSQEELGKEAIIARTNAIYSMLDVVDVSYEKMREKNKTEQTRTYQGKMILKTANFGDIERDQTLRFSYDKAQGRWLLDWDPSVIIPGLTQENDLEFELTPAKRGRILDRNGLVLAQDNEQGDRSYPYGATFGSVVGYARDATMTDKENPEAKGIILGASLGRSGLEAAYDDLLREKPGLSIRFSDSKEEVYHSKPEPGSDITTTLDMKVQEAAYQTIGGEFGAVASIAPTTGQVLALVSTPDYNPEDWIDSAMAEEEYLLKVKTGMSPGNGIFAQKYTPGSTQKLLTSVIGFKHGSLAENSGYEIYGEKWQPDTSWGGYKVTRVIPYNGWVDLHTALVLSDNIFFARTGLDMGTQAFEQGMDALGIGRKIPGKLAVQTAQISEDHDLDRDVALADSSYGQYQVQITPLQMAMTYTLLQNNGNIMEPCYLINEPSKAWLENLATPSQIQFLNGAFRDVVRVSHPTGDRSYGQMSGKTGTAEVGPGGKVNLGWFCGYDAGNPYLVTCVMINHVEDRGGSDIPTMYFGQMMDDLYANGAYQPTMPSTELAQDDSEKTKKRVA